MSTVKKMARKFSKWMKKLMGYFKNADGAVDFDKIFQFAETAVLLVAKADTMSNEEKRAAVADIIKKQLQAEGIIVPDHIINLAIETAYALLKNVIKNNLTAESK